MRRSPARVNTMCRFSCGGPHKMSPLRFQKRKRGRHIVSRHDGQWACFSPTFQAIFIGDTDENNRRVQLTAASNGEGKNEGDADWKSFDLTQTRMRGHSVQVLNLSIFQFIQDTSDYLIV